MESLLSCLAPAGLGRESGGLGGGMVIHVMSGHGVDPYFDIPMHESVNGGRKCGSF
jgi:hypothetical protein